MEFSQAAIRIIILVIPGLIFYKCYSSIVGTKIKKDWESFFEIIFISIICYLLLSLISSINFSLPLTKYSFQLSNNLKAFNLETVEPNFFEIIEASVIGIVLAFLFSMIDNRNIINKIAQKLNISYRTGRDDVWDDFLNTECLNYLTVRDYKTDYYYLCYIELYSESNQTRELVLKDVTVFDSYTGTELYQVEKLYLSRNNDDIEFEIPNYQYKEGDDKKDGTED